jgi:hypothetical protein
MRKYLACFVAAAAVVGTASAQDDDLRTYCGDMAKARGEPTTGTWALQCSRTLQVRRDYAQKADSQRRVEQRLEQNEWLIQAMRTSRLRKQAPTDAERHIADTNLAELLAACPSYFSVMKCVGYREELSR